MTHRGPFQPLPFCDSVIVEVINKQVEEKKVIRSSQHGFTKGKSCLTNLIVSATT